MTFSKTLSPSRQRGEGRKCKGRLITLKDSDCFVWQSQNKFSNIFQIDHAKSNSTLLNLLLNRQSIEQSHDQLERPFACLPACLPFGNCIATPNTTDRPCRLVLGHLFSSLEHLCFSKKKKIPLDYFSHHVINRMLAYNPSQKLASSCTCVNCVSCSTEYGSVAKRPHLQLIRHG